jgi:hypothetical protein
MSLVAAVYSEKARPSLTWVESGLTPRVPSPTPPLSGVILTKLGAPATVSRQRQFG